MANPKRKHSRSRGRKRRSKWKISLAGHSRCPVCKQPKIAHTVCGFCGKYKDRQVITVDAEEKGKQEKR